MRGVTPIIADGELTLRPGTLDDVDAVTAACQDPEILRWTSLPSPYRRAHAEAWLSAPRTDEAVNLLAFERDRLAGSFSLMEIDRECAYGEIGYWLAAHARGRGVATRAVRLLAGWAREELGLRTIEILVQAGNVRSRRVARRASFAEAGLREPPARLRGVAEKFVVYVSKA